MWRRLGDVGRRPAQDCARLARLAKLAVQGLDAVPYRERRPTRTRCTARTRRDRVPTMFRDRTVHPITRRASSGRRRRAAVLNAVDPIIAQTRCVLASTPADGPQGNTARIPADDRLRLVNRLILPRAADAKKMAGAVQRAGRRMLAVDQVLRGSTLR